MRILMIDNIDHYTCLEHIRHGLILHYNNTLSHIVYNYFGLYTDCNILLSMLYMDMEFHIDYYISQQYNLYMLTQQFVFLDHYTFLGCKFHALFLSNNNILFRSSSIANASNMIGTGISLFLP